MNQSIHTIKLANYLSELQGWGRVAGAAAAKRIRANIDGQANIELVRISLQGVRKLDIGFAAEALVGLVASYRERLPVCLVDLTDPDVSDNVAAAAMQMNVPVTAYSPTGCTILGPVPKSGNRPALAFALERQQLRATDLAAALDLSITNASTKLKELWEQGFLVRQESVAASGGMEFVYRRIG